MLAMTTQIAGSKFQVSGSVSLSLHQLACDSWTNGKAKTKFIGVGVAIGIGVELLKTDSDSDPDPECGSKVTGCSIRLRRGSASLLVARINLNWHG
jgi:hypothetical protein